MHITYGYMHPGKRMKNLAYLCNRQVLKGGHALLPLRSEWTGWTMDRGWVDKIRVARVTPMGGDEALSTIRKPLRFSQEKAKCNVCTKVLPSVRTQVAPRGDKANRNAVGCDC